MSDLRVNRPRAATRAFVSHTHWIGSRLLARSEERRRRLFEETRQRDLDESALLPGFCFPCGASSEFEVDFQYSWMVGGKRQVNWRERLVCPRCELNARMRLNFHWVCERLRGALDSRIYLTEKQTAFFRKISEKFPRVEGSEYRGPTAAKGSTDAHGVRHEDVEDLSFSAETFDAIVSQDVLEHVAHPDVALAEFRRVLKPEGFLLLTVPFDTSRRTSIVRAVRDDRGEVNHLRPPEYHFDPHDPGGCLVYTDFGWDLLPRLRRAGFERVRVVQAWSDGLGYLGPLMSFFVAFRENTGKSESGFW